MFFFCLYFPNKYFFLTSIAPEGESEENLDKTYYVYLPPELCLVHPLPGTLVRGAQRLPSIMRRVESMLLAVQLKNMINFPVPAFDVLSLPPLFIISEILRKLNKCFSKLSNDGHHFSYFCLTTISIPWFLLLTPYCIVHVKGKVIQLICYTAQLNKFKTKQVFILGFQICMDWL